MGLFRRKPPETIDAEHLLREAQLGETPTTAGEAARDDLSDAATAGVPPAEFRLRVGDVFVIHGRGTVVTGTVEAGCVSVGSTVGISRDGKDGRRARVTAVEGFRKRHGRAMAGQTLGLLLEDVSREDVSAGDVLTA